MVGVPQGVRGRLGGECLDIWVPDVPTSFMCNTTLIGQNVLGTNGTFPRDKTGHVHGMVVVQKWRCQAEIPYVYWLFSLLIYTYSLAKIRMLGAGRRWEKE